MKEAKKPKEKVDNLTQAVNALWSVLKSNVINEEAKRDFMGVLSKIKNEHNKEKPAEIEKILRDFSETVYLHVNDKLVFENPIASALNFPSMNANDYPISDKPTPYDKELIAFRKSIRLTIEAALREVLLDFSKKEVLDSIPKKK